MDQEEVKRTFQRAQEYEQAPQGLENASYCYRVVAENSTDSEMKIAAARSLVRMIQADWSRHTGLRTWAWIGVLFAIAGVLVWLLALSQLKIPHLGTYGGVETTSALTAFAVGEGVGMIVSALLGMYLLLKFAYGLDKLEIMEARQILAQAILDSQAGAFTES